MINPLHNTAIDEGVTLVIGGTGKTGRRIAQRLEERGHSTRVVARSTTPPFDWSQPANWNHAFKGVTAAYVSYAPDLAIPGAVDAIRAVVECAVNSGVERLVLLSGRGEEEAQRCERIVQTAGIKWTIVRASWFNQNFSEGEFLDMVLGGTIALPAGDVPEPIVDADDIADVAVAALTEDGRTGQKHTGQIYEVTGPRALTFNQVAVEIAHASGREVRHLQIPHATFTASIAESGAPKDIAWLLDYLFSTVLDGRNTHVCDGVQRALGRKPIDFADFARRAAASGLWNTASSKIKEAA